jgi:DNA-damage-inducible protein D
MKKELITELLEKFEDACYIYQEIECWSARELLEILGYTKWVNFLKVIDKAKSSCEKSGASISDHFADIGKMIELAKGAHRDVVDYALTRYVCYLIAQNGYPSKNEIAFAQTCFAVQPANRKF